MNTNSEKIYEDDDVVAINKPAGLLVHADGVSKEKTVTDWVMENYPDILDVGEEETLKNGEIIKRPGIVHRLDKDTSGILLICKTKESHGYFKKMFQDKSVKKEYHALVYGTIKGDEGTIDKPIGRHPADFRRRLAEEGARGEMRPAITKYEVIMRKKDASFIHAFPLTGRTHQIRVHLKSINHPVVCDPLYAPKQLCLYGLERLALHAYKITWTGMDGAEKTAIAPYPNDFETALKEFESSVA
ncbi:MAG: RluA family pseudouridine synthase [Minisyncoccia bacterium]